jgi:hypothetical protein
MPAVGFPALLSPANSDSRCPQRPRWRRARRTCSARHTPPAAVLTPRALRAAAADRPPDDRTIYPPQFRIALEKGYTPQTVMIDRPVQVGDWEPENYGGRYHGPVTLRTAFAKSMNSVAVQLADVVGIRSVIEVAKKLGVRSDLPAVPSLRSARPK